MHATPGSAPFVPSGVAEMMVKTRSAAQSPPPSPASPRGPEAPPRSPTPQAAEAVEAHSTASTPHSRDSAHGREGRPDGPVIAAPTSAGVPRAPGLRLGPPYVMAQFDPADYVLQRPRLGDGTIEQVTAAVSLAVASAVARGEVPVVLGGDHTAALGGVAGVREGLRRRARRRPVPPLFLLWLDAHPDLNTAETSRTGHLHGMVLAGLLGVGPLAVPDPLPVERVTLAGVRSIDSGEAAYLKRHPELITWSVARLRDGSWLAPLESLLERVRQVGGRLYVSLDLDVFDPGIAPGVAVPVRHGALADPLLALLRRIRGSGLLAGADVVELYPPADRERQTARLAARALGALGAAATWRDVLEEPTTAGEEGPDEGVDGAAEEGPAEEVRRAWSTRPAGAAT